MEGVAEKADAVRGVLVGVLARGRGAMRAKRGGARSRVGAWQPELFKDSGEDMPKFLAG
jgi:hypothetical protein